MKQYLLSIYTFFTTPKSSVTTWKCTQKGKWGLHHRSNKE